MAKAKKGPKSLYDKVNELDPIFASEIYASKDEDLMGRMAKIGKEQTTVEDARDEDVDLASLREQLKVAGETYSEPLKALKLKRKLIYKILKDRGKAP